MQSVRSRRKVSSVGMEVLRKQGIIVALIGIIVLGSALSRVFLTLSNLLNVLQQVSILGVMAAGMTFVLIGGAFDLSVGATLSFAAVLAIDLQSHLGVLPAILVALIWGAAVGLVNGLVVTKLHVNALIVTLGMQTIIQAIAFIYTHGFNVINKSDAFNYLGQRRFVGIPVPVFAFAFTIGISYVLLTRTSFGRSVYAFGGNREASRFSGIPVDWHQTLTFVICGLTAAFAGVIWASRFNSAHGAVGKGMELNVIAAAVIGGVSLAGGQGSVLKTAVGVLIIGTLSNVLILVSLPYYSQLVATGCIIIGAVWIDRITRRSAQ